MAPMRFRTDSVPRAGRAVAARLPELTTLALVILLAYLTVEFMWQLVARDPQTVAIEATAAEQRPRAADGGGGKPSVEQLLAADLFGTPDAAAGSAGQKPKKDAPETSLDLKLSGIVAGPGNERSRAIIAVGNEPEKSFGIGDQLTEGAVLDTIYADRVLIRRNGQLEALHLPRPESPGTGGAGRLTERSNRPRQEISMASLRRQALNNPATMGEFVRVQPVRRNGEIQGFRVRPGPDRALFNQLDLKPGDIVREVNGVTLDSQDKGLELLGKLRSADRLRLTIERDGQTRTVEAALDN